MIYLLARMPAAAPSRLEHISWIILIGTLGAAVIVRCVGLDHLPGINGDEAVFPVHASEWAAGVPLAELRTGTNLPMNPVFFGLVALVQSVLPATAWTLRLPALVHSLLTVVLAFVLFRGRGVSFAATFAALLATLPIELGYARLAWDPSAVPTVMVLALAAATRLQLVATAALFGLCLWVHPTTVFAAPILLAPLIMCRWPRNAEGAMRLGSKRALGVGALCLIVALASLVWIASEEMLPTPVQTALRGGLLEQALDRIQSPAAALRFIVLYAQFVMGPTIYLYVTGSMPQTAATLHVAAGAVLLGALIVMALRRSAVRAPRVDRAVAVGLCASLALTYVVGGLRILEPHSERYGMFLVVPTCYVLAAHVAALAATPREKAFARLGTAALGLSWLASFAIYFLAALHHPDPERHNTFRAGHVDPKQRVFEQIVAVRSPDRETVVRVEDWWLYWPLRYLAGARADLRITIEGERWNYRYPRDFEPPPLDPEQSESFGVAWAGSTLDVEFARLASERFEIGGYEPAPIVRVYRLPIAAQAKRR